MQFNLAKIASLFKSGEFALAAHAETKMQERNISNEFLLHAIGEDDPKIIEEYEYSCLILGWENQNSPLHAVVALGTVDQEYDTPILITAYKPDESKWTDDYAKRRTE